MKTHHFWSELRIDCSPEEVFRFFADPHNLEAITPPWLRLVVRESTTPSIRAGTEIEYRLRLRGIPLRWRSRITLWEPPARFVDEQVAGPYRLWRHLHSFEPRERGTLARDSVEYAAWGGPLVRRLLIAPELARIFAWRRRALSEIFAARGESRGPRARP